MKKRKKSVPYISPIQKLAKKKLKNKPVLSKKLTSEKTEKLIHRSKSHQVELEKQNEKLRTIQHALDEANEKYSNLYNLAPVGYLTVSEDGVILEANQLAAKLFGVEVNQVKNKPIINFIKKEDQDIYFLARRQLIETGTKQSVEIRMKGKNGSEFWSHLEGILYKNINGKTSCLAIINNITQRKLAEEEIKKSEEKFKLLFETIPDGILIVNLEGKFLQVNNVICKRLGYSQEELLSMNVREINAPNFAAGLEEVAKTILEKKIIFVETEHLSKSGDVIPTELTGMLFEYEGKPAVIAVARDITERKRTESQVIIQSTALNSTAITIVIADSNGQIEWVNPAFTKLTGYTSEEVLGKNPRILKSGKHDDAFYKNLWDTIRSGKIWHSELINRRKDDREYCEEMTITPLKNENGEIIRYVAIMQDITERKQAEEKIKKSEEKFRLLFETIPDGIYIADIKGKFLQVNNVICKRLGYSQEELLSMNLREIVTPNFVAVLEKRAKTLIEKKFVFGETEHLSKSGDVIPTELTSVMFEYEGKPAVITVARDITERKRTESQLIIQSTALNSTAITIVIADSNGQIEWANPAFTKLTGYTREEVLGKNPRILKSGKHDDAFYKNLWDTIRSGKIWHSELINRRKDDREYCEEMTITPLKNENGEIIRYVAIKQDITERKQAEKRIKESEEKFRLLFETIPDGILIINLEGKILQVNNVMCKRLGYSQEELISMNVREINTPNFAATLEARGKSVIENRFLFVETEHQSKSGVVIPTELSNIMFEYKGKPAILSVARDITERKKYEDEIKQAKAEAERANLSKSEFLSRMSHELRTPLNSILGFAQVMNMRELAPNHKKSVNHIMKSGKHLLDLINEVLDLSRIEAGKLRLSLEPVRLSGIISETLDIVKPIADKNNIKLEFVNSPVNDLFVNADKQKLKQVLLNIINNAVKYNRENGEVIVVCNSKSAVSSREFTENWQLRINITDTGKGIKSEDLQKLFKPFQRVGGEVAEIEGTGLGLAVAKKLTEAMHGTIGVESKIGESSTFWIELPQSEGQIDRYKRIDGPIKPETENAVVSGTILYIEDNISNIQLIEQILEMHSSSIRLITEMYGKNTLKLALDYKPDLILLDLDLPDIYGSEVLKLLQNNNETKSIPVVILSADAMSSQIEKLMKCEVKNYLTKPIDVVEFLKIVDEILDKR